MHLLDDWAGTNPCCFVEAILEVILEVVEAGGRGDVDLKLSILRRMLFLCPSRHNDNALASKSFSMSVKYAIC